MDTKNEIIESLKTLTPGNLFLKSNTNGFCRIIYCTIPFAE